MDVDSLNTGIDFYAQLGKGLEPLEIHINEIAGQIDAELYVTLSQLVKGDPFLFKDFTAEQIASFKQPAVDAGNEVKEEDRLRGIAFADKLKEVDATLIESLRQHGISFNEYITAWGARIDALASEGNTAINDITRLNTDVTAQEEARDIAEKSRVTAEDNRNTSFAAKLQEVDNALMNSLRQYGVSFAGYINGWEGRVTDLIASGAATIDEMTRLIGSVELAEAARAAAEQKRQADTAKAIADTNAAKDAAQVVVDNNVTALAGKADLGEDGFVVAEQVNPLQGLQRYFSTPAKDNVTNYKGKLAPIKTDDFMIEAVGDYSSSDSGYDVLRLGEIGYYAKYNLSVFNGIGVNSNTINAITFQSKQDTVGATNSLLLYKTFPQSKLIHIVIGRSGTSAWALVNGVKYSVTHDRVLEISNQLTISNAKKFTQLRKFNFADEEYAKKLWNGGRWWESVVPMKEINILPKIKNTDITHWIGGRTSVSKNGEIYTITDNTGMLSPLFFVNDNVKLEIGATYLIKYRAKCNASINTKVQYLVVGNTTKTTRTGFSCITNVDNMTREWQDIEVKLTILNTIDSQFIGVDNISFIMYYQHLADAIVEIDNTHTSIEKLGCTDEFLPQSFNSVRAINTATKGRDLIASNPQNITFGYDNYANDELVDYPLSTIPDFVGQKLITVPADSRTKGDVYVCGAPADGEALSARLWTKINV